VKYRLIVFDWDGTIIDSASSIAECIRDSARDLGLPVPTTERASHVIGLGLHDSLRPGGAGAAGAAVSRVRRRVSKALPGARGHDGPVRRHARLLTELKEQHLLAIATGKSRRGLDRALDADRHRPISAARAAPTRPIRSRIRRCCSS
jgi:phosphoglycolate phosphatase